MLITKRLQDIYRAEQERLETAAADYVRSYMRALLATAPDSSVATLREAAKEAIKESLNAFGDQAGALALELFDQISEREGFKADTVLCTDTISEEMMDEKVRYFAGKLVRGDLPGFTKDVTDLTRFYVKRTAYENLVRNCERNDVRYARVPSGMETCAFCFMLSSRGFVYHNEIAAQGDTPHGMHAHCDCIIVPGIAGKTHIAGYDPDEMYKRWKACAETIGASPDDYREKNTKRIMDEVSRRDFRWLNGEKRTNPIYQSKRAEYELKLHEKWTRDVLSRNGFEQFILERSNKQKEKTADLLLGGIEADYKAPESDSFNCIDQLLRDAGHKAEIAIVHLQKDRTEITKEDCEKYIRRRFKRRNLDEVLLIDYEDRIHRIK